MNDIPPTPGNGVPRTLVESLTGQIRSGSQIRDVVDHDDGESGPEAAWTRTSQTLLQLDHFDFQHYRHEGFSKLNFIANDNNSL